MAITVVERKRDDQGRQPTDGDSPSNEIPYLAHCTADET